MPQSKSSNFTECVNNLVLYLTQYTIFMSCKITKNNQGMYAFIFNHLLIYSTNIQVNQNHVK